MGGRKILGKNVKKCCGSQVRNFPGDRVISTATGNGLNQVDSVPFFIVSSKLSETIGGEKAVMRLRVKEQVCGEKGLVPGKFSLLLLGWKCRTELKWGLGLSVECERVVNPGKMPI